MTVVVPTPTTTTVVSVIAPKSTGVVSVAAGALVTLRSALVVATEPTQPSVLRAVVAVQLMAGVSTEALLGRLRWGKVGVGTSVAGTVDRRSSSSSLSKRRASSRLRILERLQVLGLLTTVLVHAARRSAKGFRLFSWERAIASMMLLGLGLLRGCRASIFAESAGKG